MKPRSLWKWAEVFTPLVWLIIYGGSYLFFRARCSDGRYIPMPLGSSPFRNVSEGRYSGSEPFVQIVRKVIPSKGMASGVAASYKPLSNSIRKPPDHIIYKDPYLYLPEGLELFLHKAYSPIQAIDYCLNGWAVGFKPSKEPLGPIK